MKIDNLAGGLELRERYRVKLVFSKVADLAERTTSPPSSSWRLTRPGWVVAAVLSLSTANLGTEQT